MTFKRLLGIVGALCAVAVLTGSVGAGAARTPAKQAVNLSTKAAVKQYLRSIHVNPRGVVIQRGLRNYAGSSCPGAGWTCTSTSHPVVQVASTGGSNVFQCASSSCAVVQTAAAPLATNTAKCIKTTGISQSCSITQTSATKNNEAIVVQTANKTSGLTQSASQTAQIIQKANGGSTVANGNTACVLQTTTIDGSTAVLKKGMPVTVTLDAHQSISIKQDSLFGGNTVKNATAGGACDARTALDARPDDHVQSVRLGGDHAEAERCARRAEHAARHRAEPEHRVTRTLSVSEHIEVLPDQLPGGLRRHARRAGRPDPGFRRRRLAGNREPVQPRPLDEHGDSSPRSQCEHAETSGAPAACDTSTHVAVAPAYTLYADAVRPGALLLEAGRTMMTTRSPSTRPRFRATTRVRTRRTTSRPTAAPLELAPRRRRRRSMDSSTTNTQSGSDVNAQTTCTGSDCTTGHGRSSSPSPIPT